MLRVQVLALETRAYTHELSLAIPPRLGAKVVQQTGTLQSRIVGLTV